MTTLDRALEIMGSNGFGLDRAQQLSGFSVNRGRKNYILTRVPFSEEVLEQYKETHILFPGVSASLVQLIKRHRQLFGGWTYDCCVRTWIWDRYFYDYRWRFIGRPIHLHRPTFYREMMEEGWYLMRKTPIAGSKLRPIAAQVAMLSPIEVIPKLNVVTLGLILSNLGNDEVLLGQTDVRCQEVLRQVERYSIGGYYHVSFPQTRDEDAYSTGWDVGCHEDNDASVSGLASCIRPYLPEPRQGKNFVFMTLDEEGGIGIQVAPRDTKLEQILGVSDEA